MLSNVIVFMPLFLTLGELYVIEEIFFMEVELPPSFEASEQDVKAIAQIKIPILRLSHIMLHVRLVNLHTICFIVFIFSNYLIITLLIVFPTFTIYTPFLFIGIVVLPHTMPL